MKKDPFGVFFHIRLNTLNMNDTEFYFSGIVKLNIERLVLGSNPSSLRFLKHMSLDLSFDKLYWVFVTLFELVKLKRGTHRSWWGKWEGNHLANNGSCLSSPIRGNLGSKMGLIRKHANNHFSELEFKKQ